MQPKTWRGSFGFIALLVLLGTIANASRAASPQALPVAIVEATPDIAKHLEVKDGQLRVGDSEVWTALRRFHVTLVENPDLDLTAKTDIPAGAALVLQLKVDMIDIGINALTSFSGEKERKLLFQEPVGAVSRQYPFYLGVMLHARIRIPGATDYAVNVGSGFHRSKGVTEYPDAQAKEQALGESLVQVDGSLNGMLGVQMLNVKLGPEAKPTFYVSVKNDYPFPVAGQVRFPTADDYRVDVAQRPFRLEPGATEVLKFELASADPQAQFVFPKWWTRTTYGTSQRNHAFAFPELDLNTALDGD